uniref:Secreted protein n=1 Tax=Caenorhabditis tropicalis TaxID=1561998 RepID=A0A1I7UBC0_9PELO
MLSRRTLVVLAVCALLFVSSIDCKKPAKGEKKASKGEKVEKVKKVKAEKVVVVDEPDVIHDNASEQAHTQEEVEEADEVVVQPQTVQKHRVSPPKSLKVASAYETCKLECRKQRDAVHAADYVEQLRTELANAEAALAAEEAEPQTHHVEAHNVPVANH